MAICHYVCFGALQGACQSVDVAAKKVMVRPFPEGAERDFTLSYDVSYLQNGPSFSRSFACGSK